MGEDAGAPDGATSQVPFAASVTSDGRTARVRISGEVDIATEPALRGVIDGALAGGPEWLVVDLSGVEFFGLAGVDVLDDARSALSRWGGELRLDGVAGGVARVLEVLGWPV